MVSTSPPTSTPMPPATTQVTLLSPPTTAASASAQATPGTEAPSSTTASAGEATTTTAPPTTAASPPQGAAPTPRSSSRIAARKRTTAELAEVRRQKRRLGSSEAMMAAAARPLAVALGPRAVQPSPDLVSAAPAAAPPAAVPPKTTKTPRPSLAKRRASTAAPVVAPPSNPTACAPEPPSRSVAATNAPRSTRPTPVPPSPSSRPETSAEASACPRTAAPHVPVATATESAPSNTVENGSSAMAGARTEFDLDEFLRTFHSVPPGSPAPPTLPPAPATSLVPDRAHLMHLPAPESPAPSEHMLRAVLDEVATALAHRMPEAAAALRARTAYPGSWTLPNDRGVLPPVAIRSLRAADFPPPANRVRGDYVPAPAHALAAHRLQPFLLSPDGLYYTPTAAVLRMRLLECLRFPDVPPVLGALWCARFGRYGVTAMHFLRGDTATRLLAGSTDANFSLDFGAHVQPPPAPASRTYYDLLGAIQGLTAYANAEWYAPMTHALYRLREFVVSNMDADPAHSPWRVQRTLHEVNHLLGSAFVHLSNDPPSWWRDFCAAVRRIEFTSPAWAIALHDAMAAQSLAPVPAAPPAASAPADPTPQPQRVTNGHHAQPRPGGIPAHIRALIPRDARGREPCLRFFAGAPCPGGSTATCSHRNRTHTWPEALPTALLTFIRRKFGSRDTDARRRA